jgi:hypothetical protein
MDPQPYNSLRVVVEKDIAQRAFFCARGREDEFEKIPWMRAAVDMQSFAILGALTGLITQELTFRAA